MDKKIFESENYEKDFESENYEIIYISFNITFLGHEHMITSFGLSFFQAEVDTLSCEKVPSSSGHRKNSLLYG